MLLEVKRIFWSIIGDSGCIVTSVWWSTSAGHVSHRSTGNMGTRPLLIGVQSRVNTDILSDTEGPKTGQRIWPENGVFKRPNINGSKT